MTIITRQTTKMDYRICCDEKKCGKGKKHQIMVMTMCYLSQSEPLVVSWKYEEADDCIITHSVILERTSKLWRELFANNGTVVLLNKKYDMKELLKRVPCSIECPFKMEHDLFDTNNGDK